MFKNILTFSFFTLLSRGLGLIRDILIAFYLGVESLADVFFVAFRLPNLFRAFFAEGAVNIAFISVSSSKLANKEQIKEFSNNILSILFVIMTLVCLMLWICAPYIIKYFTPGFYNHYYKFELTVQITRIMIPYLLCISLYSLISSILQISNHFISTAFSPIILNLCLIYALVFSYSYNVLHNLAIAVLLSGVLQFALILFIAFKLCFTLTFVVNIKLDHDVKMFFKRVVPAIFSNCITQISVWVDTVFASFIPGAVSYLYYADRVNQLPQALIGTAIGTVLLPILSKKITNNDYNEAIKLQNDALELGLIVAIPAALGMSTISYAIISVLFNYGSFSYDAVANTSKILTILAFSLPSFVINKVLLPGFYARDNFKSPMIFAMISLMINLALNLILIEQYQYTAIAIATTCSSWVNTILLMRYMNKYYSYKIDKVFSQRLTKVFLSTIVMLLVLSLVNCALEKYLFSKLSIKIYATAMLILSGILTYLIMLKVTLKNDLSFFKKYFK